MSEHLTIANSAIMWIACLPTVAIVLLQAVLFTKKTAAIAQKGNISRSECFTAFRTGMISAIGPSFSVFIVMVGLLSAVGAPIAWMRLSVVGSTVAELTCGGLGAQAVGQTLGAPDFNITGYAAALWGMSFNSISWIIAFLFIPRATKMQTKLAKYDKNYLLIGSTAALIGLMSYMTMNNCLKGWGMTAAAVASGVSILLLNRAAKKVPRLREYNMGIAMIVGMVFAALIGG